MPRVRTVFSSLPVFLILAASVALVACFEGGKETAAASCAAGPCDEGATCEDGDDGYTCTCDEGYSGDGETCCADGDGDSVCDDTDNCPDLANEDQADGDEDGVGDACGYYSIPLADLTDTASFYTYTTDAGVEVDFFAVLDSDGGVHVAFDACDVCYRAGLGYSQSGEQMVCNNCGNRFDISGIGTENLGGGCWPGYLPMTLTDTEAHILFEDLESGSWYFE